MFIIIDELQYVFIAYDRQNPARKSTHGEYERQVTWRYNCKSKADRNYATEAEKAYKYKHQSEHEGNPADDNQDAMLMWVPVTVSNIQAYIARNNNQ